MGTEAKAQAYLATRVNTASPQELRLMLLDGGIKFLQQGRDGLERKDYEACCQGYAKCRAIIVELLTTMKPEPDRRLYERMTALYSYMIRRLLESSHERDVSKADEVLELLRYDRQTWAMLMEKLEAERRGVTVGAGAAADAPARPTATGTPTASGGSFNFSG